MKTDKRELRPGEKIFSWEKKGVPVRIELGPKDLAAGTGVVARRDGGEKANVALGDMAAQIPELLVEIQKALFEKANVMRETRTVVANTWAEFTAAIEAGNFVLAHWGGDADVEKAIKTETGATIRCLPFGQPDEEGVCVKSGSPSKRRVLFASSY